MVFHSKRSSQSTIDGNRASGPIPKHNEKENRVLKSKYRTDDRARKSKKPYIYGTNPQNTLTTSKHKAGTKTQDSPSSNAFDSKLDEFDQSLINISELEKSPRTSSTKQTLPDIEGLIDFSDEETKNPTTTQYEGFASKLAKGNVLQVLQDDKLSKVDSVKEKYQNYKFPESITSKRELMKRTEQHIDDIKKILDFKMSPSIFYSQAKAQQQSSLHSIMSSSDRWQIDWKLFYGGYFGLKRQLIIGQILTSRCRKELRNAARKNDTVSYWTTSEFATYVLANEVIIRIAMEDCECDFEAAERIILDSQEYGSIVADSIEIIDDLEAGELLQAETSEFMKSISDEISQGQNVAKSPPKANLDLLDDLVNDTSSEEDIESEVDLVK